jgi:mannose-6-phosphate isomerase-like protein (cupin superfamily)
MQQGMKHMQVNKENVRHYQWGAQCDSYVLVDSDALLVKEELMPPGTREQLHYHREAEQFFYILKGTATFHIDGEVLVLNKNEGIQVIQGSRHYIKNGTTEELSFLVISAPPTGNDRVVIK